MSLLGWQEENGSIHGNPPRTVCLCLVRRRVAGYLLVSQTLNAIGNSLTFVSVHSLVVVLCVKQTKSLPIHIFLHKELASPMLLFHLSLSTRGPHSLLTFFPHHRSENWQRSLSISATQWSSSHDIYLFILLYFPTIHHHSLRNLHYPRHMHPKYFICKSTDQANKTVGFNIEPAEKVRYFILARRED